MQTLCLKSEKTIKLRRDGPALEVRVDTQAPRLYPLKRLDRVILHKSADISLSDLVECMQAGVVFCFADRRGRARGWGLGAPQSQPLSAPWKRVQQRTDFDEQLDAWLRSRTHNAIEASAKALGLESQDGSEWLANLIHQWSHRFAGEQAATDTLLWMTTEIDGLLHENLLTLGMPTDEAPAIVAMLRPVLRWRMESYRIRWLQQHHVQGWNQDTPEIPTHRDFTEFMNQQLEVFNNNAEELVQQFSRWVQNTSTPEA